MQKRKRVIENKKVAENKKDKVRAKGKIHKDIFNMDLEELIAGFYGFGRRS